MRVVFYGSGAFGLPTLSWLKTNHEVVQVVSQPDRPAGRGRKSTPTPITSFAREHGLDHVTVEDVADPSVVEQLSQQDATANVVIAFGQKMPQSILEQRFACNLHASLLPSFRGAAPINRAIMSGKKETGLSVIALAQRIDAGEIYHQIACPLDPSRTAGEIHDFLAEMGPTAIDYVLNALDDGSLQGEAQDEALVTHAAKLSRDDGLVRFQGDADQVRAQIHGVTPWPGARAQLGPRPCKIGRVEVITENEAGRTSGQLRSDFAIQCTNGAVRPLEIQPAGSRMMPFAAFCNGAELTPGSCCTID